MQRYYYDTQDISTSQCRENVDRNTVANILYTEKKGKAVCRKISAKYKQEYHFHVNYVQNKADLGEIVKLLENKSQEDTENNATIDRYFSVDHLGLSETVGHHIRGGERDNAVIVFEVIGE